MVMPIKSTFSNRHHANSMVHFVSCPRFSGSKVGEYIETSVQNVNVEKKINRCVLVHLCFENHRAVSVLVKPSDPWSPSEGFKIHWSGCMCVYVCVYVSCGYKCRVSVRDESSCLCRVMRAGRPGC